MPVAELNKNGRIEVQTEFRDKEAIKAVPGSRWDPETRTWSVPLSWATCRQLRGVFGDRLHVGNDLAEWAWQERRSRVDPAMALRSEINVDAEDEIDEPLFPFQRAGRRFLRTAKGALLGDPMGLGKTAQGITGVPDDGWPVVVICPNTTKPGWRTEIERWLPEGVDVRVLDGGTVQRRKLLKDITDGQRVAVVVNWEGVRLLSRLASYGSIRLKRCTKHGGDDPAVKDTQCEAHPKELNEIPFRTVIVDEAHRMKDPHSKQTRAVWAVQHGESVRYCYAMTGTPVANHIGDLWAIMHGVAPADFPRKTAFLDRYAVTSYNAWGGLEIAGVNPQHRDELYAILDPRYRRIPKEVALPQLPPKVYEERVVDMDPKQAKAYREMEETMVAGVKDGTIVATNVLTYYVRLLQFASSFAEVNGDGELRLQAPSCKVNAMEEILGDIGEDESVVFAAVSRQLIELCEERLRALRISFATIKGGMTSDQRAQAIDAFQNGQVRVMLLTTQAGGVGITLTRAPYLVRLQRSWSLIDNLQLEDRIYRIGSEQHKQVTIIDVYANGTVEMERQREALDEKAGTLEDVTRDKQRIPELLKLLAGR